jgi:hypothetical protein
MWPPSKAETTALFDARSGSYDDSQMHHWLARFTADTLRLASGSLVLDAALASTALLNRNQSIRPIALDLSSGLLAAARGGLPGLMVVQGDVEQLPFSAAVLDAVICVSAAAFFPNPQLAVDSSSAECCEQAEPLYSRFGAADGVAPSRLLRQFGARYGVEISDPNGRLGTPARLTQVLTAAGLHGVEMVSGVWHRPWAEGSVVWASLLGGPLAQAIRRRNDTRSRRTSWRHGPTTEFAS